MLFGFIGVGNMGGPVARNLIRIGKDVIIFDVKEENVERCLAVGTNAKKASSIAELSDCDYVFSCLPMPQHIESVILAENGLYDHMKKGAVHIDLSTLTPALTKRMEDTANAKGLGFIQCTQGKSPSDAEKAEQPMYVGGDDKVVNPIWEDIFKRVSQPLRVANAEAATAIKLLGNMMAGVIISTVGEAIKTGEAVGMDAHDVVALLSASGCNSFQLGVRGPFMANRDFKNRFAVDLMLKDLRLGCEMAKNAGVELTLIEDARKCYEKAHDAGFGGEDSAAVYKVIEKRG